MDRSTCDGQVYLRRASSWWQEGRPISLRRPALPEDFDETMPAGRPGYLGLRPAADEVYRTSLADILLYYSIVKLISYVTKFPAPLCISFP